MHLCIIAVTLWTFDSKLMPLFFNTLSRFVIPFLPRSRYLLISWLPSPSAEIFEPKIIKSVTVSIVSPSISHEVMRPVAMILIFWTLSFKPAFSLSSFTFIKRLFSSSLPYAIRVVSSAYLRLLIFLPGILIPARDSFSPAFRMMYSAYKLNKQGDHMQPWCTPFPVLTTSLLFHVQLFFFPMSSFNGCFLTCIQVSQEADNVVWYSHLFRNFPEGWGEH